VTRLGRIPGARGTGPARVLIRPEQVVLAPGGVPARLKSLAFRGDHTLPVAEAGGTEVPLRVQSGEGVVIGAGLRVGVRGERVLIRYGSADSLPR
jgi:hypothetical protein